MKIREIIKITKGKLVSGDVNIDIDPALISTDTRTVKRGGLFIALKGPNFDGNEFAEDAFKKGARGAIVTQYTRNLRANFIRNTQYKKVVIRVKDGTKALQQIAAYHRSRFKIPVIAVTGSNGKTTVKDMIWTCLSTKYNVLRNEGTRNNHIGVPQTLLGLKKNHRACVLELGANHKGEIRDLSNIAKPTSAVITNIGPSHLEFFGDLDGVFSTKKEILTHLNGPGSFVTLNGDDYYLSKIRGKAFRIIRFGMREGNDYVADTVFVEKSRLKFTVNGLERFELKLLGPHNVYNALAAIAVARELGISFKLIKKTLRDFKPSYMRLNIKTVNGIDIINDSYNSNPMSMTAALETVKDYPAPSKWIVSADMLELGKRAIEFHRIIGENIARSGVRGLLTFGSLSKYTLSGARTSGMVKDALWHCSSHSDIASILKRVAKKGDVILLKGSRGMQMEKVLECLENKLCRKS